MLVFVDLLCYLNEDVNEDVNYKKSVVVLI